MVTALEQDWKRRFETGESARFPWPNFEDEVTQSYVNQAMEIYPTYRHEIVLESFEHMLVWAPENLIEHLTPTPLLFVTTGGYDPYHTLDDVQIAYSRAGEPKQLEILPYDVVAALLDQTDYQVLSFERIVRECALCDTHGFLVTAKNAESETGTGVRQKISKSTLIDFSYALALPDRHAKTEQLHTRAGTSKEEEQMLMKIPARSGAYAFCIRYTCAGIGADTERWLLFVKDQAPREKRHRAILRALRDCLVSPEGALVATMLPHLTGFKGVLMVRTNVGRAPLYSALESDFVMRLGGMTDETCTLYPFETIDAFYTLMNTLIATSVPELHPFWRTERVG